MSARKAMVGVIRNQNRKSISGALIAILLSLAVPLEIVLPYSLQEADASPSSIRLGGHTCNTFFLGTWNGTTKTCVPAANQFFALPSGETLVIPKKVTLRFPGGNTFNLTAGTQIVNKGNISYDYDCSFPCLGVTINVQSEAKIINYGNIEPAFNSEGSPGLFIEEGGSVYNSGNIRSAYGWFLINNGTLNNYGSIAIGLDGRVYNYGSLYNYGSISIGEGIRDFGAGLVNFSTGTIHNHGTIFIVQDFDNEGTIINDGQILNCGNVGSTGTITGNPISPCPP